MDIVISTPTHIQFGDIVLNDVDVDIIDNKVSIKFCSEFRYFHIMEQWKDINMNDTILPTDLKTSMVFRNDLYMMNFYGVMLESFNFYGGDYSYNIIFCFDYNNILYFGKSIKTERDMSIEYLLGGN